MTLRDIFVEKINLVKSLKQKTDELSFELEAAKAQLKALLEDELPMVMTDLGMDTMSFRLNEEVVRLDLVQEVTASVSYENGEKAAPILERLIGAPVKWAYTHAVEDVGTLKKLLQHGGKAKPDIAWQTLRKYVTDALKGELLTEEERELLKVKVKDVVMLK